MATVLETIDRQYGSLSKFAETVWQNMGGLTHGGRSDLIWAEVTQVCKKLLGDTEGEDAAALLKKKGYFSIVFPD